MCLSKRIKKYISLWVLVLLTTACSKNIGGGEDVGDKIPKASQISIMVDSESFTRAIPTPVETELDMGTVGFYCAYTGQNNWESSTKDFDKYDNTKFSYESPEWTTTSPASWGHSSITDKYTFYAYSPYSDPSSPTKGINPSIDTDGNLNIDYTLPNNTSDQVDLLVADPRKDIHPQSGGKVSMKFNHALARVKFLAKVDKATYAEADEPTPFPTPSVSNPKKDDIEYTYETSGPEYVGSVKVTSITWESLANQGTLKASANSVSTAWTNHTEPTNPTTITLVDPHVELRKDENAQTPFTAQAITEEYFILPQDCNTTTDIITITLGTITYKRQWEQKWKCTNAKKKTWEAQYEYPIETDPTVIGSDNTKAKVITLSQSSMSQIKMGKVYNITITIPTDDASYETQEFTIDISVSDWDEANVDIPKFE